MKGEAKVPDSAGKVRVNREQSDRKSNRAGAERNIFRQIKVNPDRLKRIKTNQSESKRIKADERRAEESGGGQHRACKTTVEQHRSRIIPVARRKS